MLKGISITDYRSIGEAQAIGPLGKINLFVGPNNSGKSNVLRFVNENLLPLIEILRENRKQSLVQAPHLRRDKPTRGGLAVAVSIQSLQKLLQAPNAPLASLIHQNLAPNDILWIDERWPDEALVRRATEWGDHRQWHAMWTRLTRFSGGGLKENWIPETLRFIRQLIPPAMSVFAIPIDRSAGHQLNTEGKNDSARVFGGRDAVLALAAMQNPPYATFDSDRERFNAVQAFVRVVTDDATANLSVPHQQNEILVQLRGQRHLPLASLGSGIEQVVLHAIAATSMMNGIVTFEEPELHLHPILQRQLLTYLAKTSNQYFISTHSAHIIDALHADSFHVRLVEGETIIEKAITDAQHHRICIDLGYRPSDIVQSNCAIWVEGPSDRIYIRHWLKRADEHLSEHVHFSVMFYGGKLLSHLSAGETDLSDRGLRDLIELRELNRQVAVVIDSDRRSANDAIRTTKTRVAEEIARYGGFVWISEGREIENYVPPDVLSVAVESVAPGRGAFVRRSPFRRALPSATAKSSRTVDKVATAQKVAEAGSGLQMLDLKERVQQLAAFIRKANGLPPVA